MVIPGGAFELRAAVRQRDQLKLPGARFEKTIEVGRVKVFIRCPFLHGRGILRDGKFQQPRLVPHLNGFNESPSGEFTMTFRADAAAMNARADRVGDAESKHRFFGWRKFGKAHDVLPNLCGRRLHDHSCRDAEHRQGRRLCVFDQHQHRGGKRHAEDLRRFALPPIARLDLVGDAATHKRHRRSQRHRHDEANDPFNRNDEQCDTSDDSRKQRDGHATAKRLLFVIAEDQYGQKAECEWKTNEERPAILTQDGGSDPDADGG